MKKRIDQSRDNVTILRKGQNSRHVSPLFKQQLQSAKDSQRARALKTLLEAKARWNATRMHTSAKNVLRIVEKTSRKNLELRKELLYSWERGFIEDKPIKQCGAQAQNLLRKDKSRKSGKAMTNTLKGKVIAETPSKWPYHCQKNTSRNRTKRESRWSRSQKENKNRRRRTSRWRVTPPMI